MYGIRGVLAVAMVIVGAVVVVRMVPYTWHNPSGIVLGLAMMALGLYRLKQLRTARGMR